MKKEDPINQQLRTAMQKRSISVSELSDLLKVPADRIYKWKQGKAAPKLADREIIVKWLEDPNWKNVPENGNRGTNDNPAVTGIQVPSGNQSTLIESLLGTLTAIANQLLTSSATTNRILERQEKRDEVVESKIDQLLANSNIVVAASEALKFGMEAGTMVALQSLARLEGISENDLLTAVDNIRNDLATEVNALYNKNIGGKENTVVQKPVKRTSR